ncbi:Phosphatidylinositol 3 [Hyphodiscus hymeniophilus]|uniref:Phosphatidylinositol 3 n=1 Tax=Hyphodiscus hymeniophilus TaxID=353542 RepID=A0A9P7AZ86_9HELO|nr:Phosphatidylinositol 3 [Hyphodiscus hymeniophilus]
MEQSENSPLGKTSLEIPTPTRSRRSSIHVSRKTSWGTPIPPPSSQQHSTKASKEEVFDDVDLTTNSGASEDSAGDELNTLDNLAALGLSFNADDTQVTDASNRTRFSLEGPEPFGNRSLPIPLDNPRPFNKWVRDIQKRAGQRRQTVSCDVDGSTLERELFESPAQARARHKKSSSESSFGFVTAVRSATVSLASFSVAPRSRRTGVSSRLQRTDRSSKASQAGRLSEDSSYITRGVMDQDVLNRLFQRRRVIEEIINTEESYVGDVKFLMHVYVTLLASVPTLSLSLRASINRNLNDIVELHEELLGDLHRVVPHSEYTQMKTIPVQPLPTNGHHRWRSLDAVPENATDVAWLQTIPGMTAEPKVAGEVARVFGKKMNRFFVYEEYGAKYELMMKDVSTTYRTMPQWDIFQKGFEALASSIASINSQNDNAKKALAIGDLLVKPIQRVCKYPLLFAELLKQTPVCDCPDSHIEIENVLIRLREATTEINRATGDPRMKALMEKTWLLQDRLVFADMPDARSKSTIRGLGHVHLCGVLHVSWQTREGVDGHYLICLLYRDFLLLASAPRADQIYHIQACISLSELRVEEVDNGRGLQCHTAPFSWKLVFEYDHQLFETTMSACSPKEELEWRRRLTDRSCKDSLDAGEQALYTSLSLNIKPMGTVFGKPGTIARRISIHRATTVGPMSGLCQVIIKNTNAFKDIPSSASTTAINRSQSLLTTNRIPVLSPSRGDRTRLETLLSDIWTRDVLPFPGMTGRARSEHPVRASASSMMRKLSVASITSNFTKRSGSIASLHRAAEEDALIDAETQKYSPPRAESGSGESWKQVDMDEMSRSRLSVIQDEKENFKEDSFENHPNTKFGPNGSPVGTIRRLATLKGKKSWAHDGRKIITPPLRTSSANSVNQNRAVTPLSTVTDAVMEDKETAIQGRSAEMTVTPQKQKKWSKGNGKNRSVVTESFRNLFR